MRTLRHPLVRLTVVGAAVLAVAFWKTPTDPQPFGRQALRRTEASEGKLASKGKSALEARSPAEGEEGPGFDDPDEFARYLTGIKIPADRTVPDYPAGYQRIELQKAVQAVAMYQGTPGVQGAPLPWISRGPGTVSGRVRGVVVDPDDATNNTWFVASVGGGIWKTTNAGAAWQWLTPDFPVLSTSTIAMAASNHNVLFAGTGESFYNADVINGDGILKSTNRGVTWSPLASTAGNAAFNNVARIIVDPTNPSLVLAATTRGRFKEYLNPRSSIFRSSDGGISWTEVYASTSIGTGGLVRKVLQIVADPTDFNILYATVDEIGILKSTNRGLTWSTINAGITIIAGRFELAISPVDHNRLYAAAEGTTHSELWISTNAGVSWSRTTETATDPNWLGSQGWYDNTIVCHPTDVNIVYIGGIWLWKVALSGTNRTSTALTTSIHPDNHGLYILNPGGAWRILNTSDGGVAVSTSTDTGFNQTINGLVTTQFYGVDKRPGASAYAGGTQDNGTWQSPLDPAAATAWNFVIGGDGFETAWNFNDPLKLIGGYQYNGLQRSVDGGATWSSALTSVSPVGIIDSGAGNAPFITKIARNSVNPDRLVALGKQGAWVSNDFGATWSLSAIAPATWGPISTFHCAKISRADPNVIWAGSRMDGTGRIHRSTNGGASFVAVPNYTTVTMGVISGLATHPTDSNTAYALFGFAQRPKILRTTDGGTTWQDLTGFESSAVSTNGFPDVAVYDLQVFSNDPNRLWAATEIGLVESLNGGTTWALANNGLPNVGIWFLTEVEDEVIAGTHGRGIWSVGMPDLIVGKTFKPLIEALFQRPDGQIEAHLNLRSQYDTTEVKVDGVHVAGIGPNTLRQMVTVVIPVVSAGTKLVVVASKKGVTTYNSVTRTIDAFAPRTPTFVYTNDFETPTSDFTGSLFTIGPMAGFTGNAIQSPHPYADNTNPTYVLSVPIRVAQSGATLEFDEEALVEPGEPGSVFPDPDFYDYVVVEGSLDGSTWVPLAPGWDCRAYPEWLAAFPNSPSPALLRHRTIDLLDAFNWNDTILVRFRLFADAGASGWGWIVDNLQIQVNGQSAVGDEMPKVQLALRQSVPNPLQSSTSIQFSLPAEQAVSLSVFDVQGRLVRGLVSGKQPAGDHSVNWDGRDESGQAVANGMYFYKLATGDQSLKRKLVVMR